jgi:hypothetical protein
VLLALIPVFKLGKRSDGATALIPTFSPRRRRTIERPSPFSCAVMSVSDLRFLPEPRRFLLNGGRFLEKISRFLTKKRRSPKKKSGLLKKETAPDKKETG